MNFIDIIQTDTEEPRVSTLAAYGESLKVVGVLPHGYNFRPTTAKDRDNLVHWLNKLEYGS